MTHTKNSILLIAFAAVLLITGCGGGGAATRQRPVALEKIVEYNNKAEAAFLKGDHDGALRFYAGALRISRAVEDVDSIALNTINLATVYHAKGLYEEAHKSIEGLFDLTGLMDFSDTRLAEAATVQAAVYMDEGNTKMVYKWVDTATSHCQRAGCAGMAKVEILKSRAILVDQDNKYAYEYASKGLKLARSAGDRREEANALRVLGGAALALGNIDEAAQHYTEALEVDKEIGAIGKVPLDLMGLAEVALAVGKTVEAKGYCLRAYSAFDAAGDLKGAERAFACKPADRAATDTEK